MANKFAVIGLDAFGMNIAVNLARRGAEVIAVDENMELIEDIKDKVTYAAKLDPTDSKALKSAGIDKVDAVVISIGSDFEKTMLTAMMLRQIGIVRIVARARTQIQESILERIGVHQVVNPDLEISSKIASNLINKDVLDYIQIGGEYNIIQVKAPRNMIGKSLQELDLRIRYNLNLITLKRQYEIMDEITNQKISKERIYGVPTAGTVIQENDILIILGRDKDLMKLVE